MGMTSWFLLFRERKNSSVENGRDPKVMLMAPTYERITPVAEPPIGRGSGGPKYGQQRRCSQRNIWLHKNILVRCSSEMFTLSHSLKMITSNLSLQDGRLGGSHQRSAITTWIIRGSTPLGTDHVILLFISLFISDIVVLCRVPFSTKSVSIISINIFFLWW